jgi:hypothetical protein
MGENRVVQSPAVLKIIQNGQPRSATFAEIQEAMGPSEKP